MHIFIFIPLFGVYLSRVFLWRSENSKLQTKSLSSILLDVLEAVARRWSLKKVFLEISQNSQENNCARVSFLIKTLWHRCFPVNFEKFQRTLFLTEHLRRLLLMYPTYLHKKYSNLKAICHIKQKFSCELN